MTENYQVRRNWGRAAACWRGPLNPVKYHHEFLELIFALGGPGLQSAYDALCAHPSGQRLLAEKPVLTDALLDDELLRSLPRGSLGHAYYDFMRQNRLDGLLYTEAGHIEPIGRRLGWDEDFYYAAYRGLVTHDLLHVLGGYGPDLGGEYGVVAFTHGQSNDAVTRMLKWGVQAAPIGASRARLRQFWKEAVQRSRQADFLMAQPYEELLDQPLDEVRSRLGIAPFDEAHPDGPLYLPFQLGRRKDRLRSSAYEPYVYDPERDHRAA